MSTPSSPSEPIEQPTAVPPEPPRPIRWRSWPVCDNPLRGAVVVAILIASALVVGWLSGRTYLGVVALVALAVSLWRFFLPVVFELREEGIHQRLFGRQRRIPWIAIRRFRVCSTGVLLLPSEDRSAMAAFRGLYLPWTSHRDEVLDNIGHYLEKPGSRGYPEVGSA